MQVEIWSDIVCPWCYIGKRHFAAALEAFEHRDEVDVLWRSFELDPSAPAARDETSEQMLARKYGMAPEQAAAANERVTAVAAAVGLDFRLDIARPGNSLDAHRLVQLATLHDRQEQAVERLMRAYFCEAAAIADHATLVSLGCDIGLDADDVRQVLAGTDFSQAVRADEALAAQLGIQAVPCFVIDCTFGVSGAQPPEQLLRALENAWERAADRLEA